MSVACLGFSSAHTKGPAEGWPRDRRSSLAPGRQRGGCVHVFGLFTQGERSLARTECGLGIGPAMVKKLVEVHGGWGDAHSDGPGKGR